MFDKQLSLELAVARIADGMTVMVGGFGSPGTPFGLVGELLRQGQKHLTLIKNDANETGLGLDLLLAAGQVDRLIVSHIGLNSRAVRMMNGGTLAVEFCAQGILAERIRAGGAGLHAVLTDVGMGTLLADGKQTVTLPEGPVLVETALRADIALVHAARGDNFGNLVFSGTARNFNPLMAMAADMVIAEVEHMVGIGEILPNDVQTPGPFIDAVVPLEEAVDVARTA